MQKIFFFLIALTLFSCKKDDDTPSTVVNSITGQIDNWTQGSDKIMKAAYYKHEEFEITYVEVGSCSIDNNGNFTIKSLSLPKSADLISLDSLINNGKQNFKLSNTKVKTLKPDLQLLIYSGNEIIGNVRKGIFTDFDLEKVGDYEVYYIYVDSEVSVTGSNSVTNSGITSTTNVNIHLGAGWNKVFSKITTVTESLRIKETVMTEPAGGKWIFENDYKK